MSDKLPTNDKAVENEGVEQTDSTVPSLEDQAKFVSDQGKEPKVYRSVVTNPDQEAFTLVESGAADSKAFFGFGDEEVVAKRQERPPHTELKPDQVEPSAPTDEDDEGKVSMTPDGKVRVEFKDGTVSETKDGTTITRKPGGTVLESRADGTHIQYDPDGGVITEKEGLIERKEPEPDGTIIVLDTNTGTVISKDKNGNVTKSVTREDGIVETDLPGGAKKFSSSDPNDQWDIIKYKDGSWTFISEKTGERHYDKSGDVASVTKVDQDGNEVTEYSDGSKLTIMKDRTVISENGKGFKSTHYPGGVMVDEFKDGTRVTYGTDKSKLTELPNGTRLFKDADGKERVLDDGEQIAFRYR